MIINKKHLISFGLITCILAPKVNLISFEGFYQGIRVDDLFLLFGIFYIILQKKLFLHTFPGREFYFLFFGTILMYSIFSLYEHGFLSIILGLRWLEYSIYFVLLFYSSLNSGHIRKFIVLYIIINSIVVLLQYFGIVGGIYSHGYFKNVSRVAGLTGGSWELSAVISLFTVSLIYDKNLKYNKKIILVIISAVLIYLSGTRTGMIAFVVASIFAFIQFYKINYFGIILFILVSTLFYNNTRSKHYIKINNIELSGSLAYRFDEWYKQIILMDNYDYIIGGGLGSSGMFMDGMYVKIFLEMGIIGLLLFLVYYYKFLKSFKAIALVGLIFCLTIDFFSASKIMFALYLSVYYLSMMHHEPLLVRLDKRSNKNLLSTIRNINLPILQANDTRQITKN